MGSQHLFERSSFLFERSRIGFERSSLPFERSSLPSHAIELPFERRLLLFERNSLPWLAIELAFERSDLLSLAFGLPFERRPLLSLAFLIAKLAIPRPSGSGRCPRVPRALSRLTPEDLPTRIARVSMRMQSRLARLSTSCKQTGPSLLRVAEERPEADVPSLLWGVTVSSGVRRPFEQAYSTPDGRRRLRPEAAPEQGRGVRLRARD